MHVSLCAYTQSAALPLCDDLRFHKHLSSLHVSLWGNLHMMMMRVHLCVHVCEALVLVKPCSLVSWHLTYYDACSACPMGLGLLSASMAACPRLHSSHWISSHHKTSHHITFMLSHSHNHCSSVSLIVFLCPFIFNSRIAFSFSFALMCLTHLLFPSCLISFLLTLLHPLPLFCPAVQVTLLSFSSLLCLSPCVFSLQPVSVPPVIFSLLLFSHQAN